ncbi:hypothetical protein BC829DRAFT_397524 [Chytridium lagenaria]|nr:hypothetical protein BC829DRAFT_397524 [Chytridium lagenaria]
MRWFCPTVAAIAASSELSPTFLQHTFFFIPFGPHCHHSLPAINRLPGDLNPVPNLVFLTIPFAMQARQMNTHHHHHFTLPTLLLLLFTTVSTPVLAGGQPPRPEEPSPSPFDPATSTSQPLTFMSSKCHHHPTSTNSIIIPPVFNPGTPSTSATFSAALLAAIICVALAVAVVVLIVFLYMRRRKQRAEKLESSHGGQSMKQASRHAPAAIGFTSGTDTVGVDHPAPLEEGSIQHQWLDMSMPPYWKHRMLRPQGDVFKHATPGLSLQHVITREVGRRQGWKRGLEMGSVPETMTGSGIRGVDNRERGSLSAGASASPNLRRISSWLKVGPRNATTDGFMVSDNGGVSSPTVFPETRLGANGANAAANDNSPVWGGPTGSGKLKRNVRKVTKRGRGGFFAFGSSSSSPSAVPPSDVVMPDKEGGTAQQLPDSAHKDSLDSMASYGQGYGYGYNISFQGGNVGIVYGKLANPKTTAPFNTSNTTRNSFFGGASIAQSTPGRSSILSSQSSFGTRDSQGGFVYKVLSGFRPTLPDEMELGRGELISVYAIFEDSWAYGLNVTTGKTGVFPLNSIRRRPNRSNTTLKQQHNADTSSNSITGKRGNANRPPSISSSSVAYPASITSNRETLPMATLLRSQPRSVSLGFKPPSTKERKSVYSMMASAGGNVTVASVTSVFASGEEDEYLPTGLMVSGAIPVQLDRTSSVFTGDVDGDEDDEDNEPWNGEELGEQDASWVSYVTAESGIDESKRVGEFAGERMT